MVSLLSLSRSRNWRAVALSAAMAAGTILAFPLTPPFAAPAQAATVSVQIRDRLSRYGGWERSARYGEVWVPSVATNWRPYTLGRWVWTDDGWYWDSAEPFGDVVFHYGRWAYDPDLGWVWIVGEEWAPAWVVWRESDADIGWVPAPPSDEVVVEDVWWSFVPVAAFGAPRLVSVIRPVEYNQVLVRNTTIINRKIVINQYGDAGKVRVGKETIPVDAGPAIGRLPTNVVAKVHAAAIVPPPRGASFAAARLDPSKAAAVKQAAIKPALPGPPLNQKQAAKAPSQAGTKNAAPAGSIQKAQKNTGPAVKATGRGKPETPTGKKAAAVVPGGTHKQKSAAASHFAPNVAAQKTQKGAASGMRTAEGKKAERPAVQGQFTKAPVVTQHKPAGQPRVATMARAPSQKPAHQMARMPEQKMMRPPSGQVRPAPRRPMKCDPHDPRCRRNM